MTLYRRFQNLRLSKFESALLIREDLSTIDMYFYLHTNNGKWKIYTFLFPRIEIRQNYDYFRYSLFTGENLHLGVVCYLPVKIRGFLQRSISFFTQRTHACMHACKTVEIYYYYYDLLRYYRSIILYMLIRMMFSSLGTTISIQSDERTSFPYYF